MKLMGAQADLETLLDESPMSPFQILIVVLCGLLVMIDGFDTQVIGMVAPAIAEAWHLPAAAFGPVFGIGLLGGLVGALTLGSSGDKFGRKPILIVAVLLWASMSLCITHAHTLQQLMILRLLSGFGLGSALPGLIALTSEYAPRNIRASVTALMYTGFPIGSVLAGVASAQFIPRFGWSSVFYVCAIFPFCLLPLFAFVAPESLRFLALKGRREKVEKILARMNCAGKWNGQVGRVAHVQGSPIVALFQGGRALGTALLWATLFLSLLLGVFLVSWLPLLARAEGIGLKSAVLSVSALNLGAVLGCFLIGRLAKRFGPAPPIAAAYGLGGVAVACMSLVIHSGAGLLITTFVAGGFVIGAQMSAIGLSASFYDTGLRATGVGWSLGSGRVGAVVGPVVGGLLIARHVPLPFLFVIAGGVGLVASACVFMIPVAVRRVRGPTEAVGAIDAAHDMAEPTPAQ